MKCFLVNILVAYSSLQFVFNVPAIYGKQVSVDDTGLVNNKLISVVNVITTSVMVS